MLRTRTGKQSDTMAEGKVYETSARVAVVIIAEILIQHLPNTNPKHFHYPN
jgi:hypothetical protein